VNVPRTQGWVQNVHKRRLCVSHSSPNHSSMTWCGLYLWLWETSRTNSNMSGNSVQAWQLLKAD
jgi:hypothetical protein